MWPTSIFIVVLQHFFMAHNDAVFRQFFLLKENSLMYNSNLSYQSMDCTSKTVSKQVKS